MWCSRPQQEERRGSQQGLLTPPKQTTTPQHCSAPSRGRSRRMMKRILSNFSETFIGTAPMPRGKRTNRSAQKRIRHHHATDDDFDSGEGNGEQVRRRRGRARAPRAGEAAAEEEEEEEWALPGMGQAEEETLLIRAMKFTNSETLKGRWTVSWRRMWRRGSLRPTCGAPGKARPRGAGSVADGARFLGSSRRSWRRS